MKVCIVGGAPSSKDLAPIDDPEWKIWILGSRSSLYGKVDKIFEMHDNVKDRYEADINKNGSPLVVGKGSPLDGEVFPYYEEAAKVFGDKCCPYLTSSLSYMMVYAIFAGAEQIMIVGVDMSIDESEYFRQRPCMEAWIGYARGKGIKVTLPDVCPMIRTKYLYGSNESKPVDRAPFSLKQFSLMAKKHYDRIEEIRAEISHLESLVQSHGGCVQAYETMARTARALEDGNDIPTLTDNVVLN